MAQPTLDQRLRDVSDQNTRLLQTLSDTDYAVSAAQQSDSYIKTLKDQIAAHEVKLRRLTHTVAMEYLDHKKYRDSHVKRVSYWVTGGKDKFQEKASKEEKEWLDAVQKEIQAKNELEQLKVNLKDCESTNAELKNVVNVHQATQRELDELYNKIFQGATPDLPQEDEWEQAVQKSKSDFNAVQARLSAENQVMAILLDADKFMKRALLDIHDAEGAATADLWGVGGSFSEMAERSALSQAQSHVSQVEMLMGQANRLQPAVGHLGEMKIAKQSLMGDVFFDNIFSDLNMRDEVIASRQQLQASQNRLTAEIKKEDERVKQVQVDLARAKRALGEKREELQKIRAAAFERLSGNATVPNEAPPTYAP